MIIELANIEIMHISTPNPPVLNYLMSYLLIGKIFNHNFRNWISTSFNYSRN